MAEKIVKLTGTYMGHGGEFTQLTFREPTARDYIQNGLPIRQIRSDDGTENKVDFAGVIKWTSALSGVEQLLLEKLNKNDLWAMIGEVSEWIGADEVDEKN